MTARPAEGGREPSGGPGPALAAARVRDGDGSPDLQSRQSLEAAQASALWSMVEKVAGANPFYSPRLHRFAAACAAQPDAAGLLESFRALVPFTTKAELVADQATHPPYGSNLTFPLDHYTRYSQTSATTAAPLRWLDTPESWAWMVDNWERVFRAAGVGPADRVFFAFSFGPFLGFWTAFDAATRIGCLAIPGGGMGSAARAQAVMANQATVVCCTPTYAIHLGQSAAEAGIDLSRGRVRAVIVGGEPGGCIPATRDRIERLWPGARTWDHHGMTEIGPVTYECPARRGLLHVIEASFLPEIVDPGTGLPAGPGEEGELVLTNLGRIGSPLFRYRTGDIVRPARETTCACGRDELGLVGGILGRADDMVVIRGVNLYPGAVEDVVRRFDDVAEYRVEVRSIEAMPEVSLLLEPTPGCADADRLLAEVRRALRAAFNLRIPVAAATPGSLPRFEMKTNRWVRQDR